MHLTIATEDELSEAALERLVREAGRFEVVQRLRQGGYGYLKRLAPGLNKAAAGHPYLMLVDLDDNLCPPELLESFLGTRRKHTNFQFRVAVRSVESWLLADPQFITDFLGLPAAHSEAHPDRLRNPKRDLIRLATRSRKAVRHDLVPRSGTSAIQGPNYNAPLVSFVRVKWNVAAACQRSESLRRCLAKIEQWNPRVAER